MAGSSSSASSQAAIDLGLLMRLRAAIVGTVLRSRSLEDKIRATRDFARDVLSLLASGRVRPVLNAVLPMARAREAHERLEKNDAFGKLVLVP